MKAREFLEKYDADEIQEMMDNGLLNEQIEEMRATGRTDGQIGEQLAKRWSDEKMDKVIASRASAKVYDQLDDKRREFNQGLRSNPTYTAEQEAEIAELERRLAVLQAQCDVDVKDSGVICKLVVPDKVVAPSNIQIPDGVVGTIGMVAMLQRVRPEDDRKWVAVRRPVGMVTSLVGSKNPVFAWQVLVLGDPVQVNGKPRREIYVPDQCLKPMGVITPEQVEVFVKALANEDFNAALDDLAIIAKAWEAEMEHKTKLGGNPRLQGELESMLETMPAEEVFEDAGFVIDQAGGKCINWPNEWLRSGIQSKCPENTFSELLQEENAVRGEVLAQIAKAWREQYPDAPLPAELSGAAIYEDFLHVKRTVLTF
jgi:hypothetical protein